jgi:hypothetical protein
LDGEHTFLDLALQMNRDAIQVTRSLMPYIQMNFVETIEIPDLPMPISLNKTQENKGESPTEAQQRKPKQETLIACIDDSPLICQAMEKIITAEGYRFIGESNDLRALPLMLEQKPFHFPTILLQVLIRVFPKSMKAVCIHLYPSHCSQRLDSPVIAISGLPLGLISELPSAEVIPHQYLPLPQPLELEKASFQ